MSPLVDSRETRLRWSRGFCVCAAARLPRGERARPSRGAGQPRRMQVFRTSIYLRQAVRPSPQGGAFRPTHIRPGCSSQASPSRRAPPPPCARRGQRRPTRRRTHRRMVAATAWRTPESAAPAALCMCYFDAAWGNPAWFYWCELRASSWWSWSVVNSFAGCAGNGWIQARIVPTSTCTEDSIQMTPFGVDRMISTDG